MELTNNNINKLENKEYDVVIFHYPCQDGLTSGWVTDYYHKKVGKQIVLYPMKHGAPYDYELLNDKKVIFCDFAPSAEILEELEKICKKITILDHHITAHNALKDKSYAIFDMNKSGAGLTWEYFFPELPMPMFIQMVQDRDLWKWVIPESKEFTAGLFTLWDGYERDNFTELFAMLEDIYLSEDKFNFCLGLGQVISKTDHQKAKLIAESACKRVDNFMGHRVCVVNCPVEHASEVGNLLSSMDTIDFAVMWTYNNVNESYYVSLRSSNKVDVSKIAKAYGGGGHVNASGMSTRVFPPVLFNNPYIPN